MKESDILYQNGRFWVLKTQGARFVMIDRLTHAESESAYGDLSLAQARADWLAKHGKPYPW